MCGRPVALQQKRCLTLRAHTPLGEEKVIVLVGAYYQIGMSSK